MGLVLLRTCCVVLDVVAVPRYLGDGFGVGHLARQLELLVLADVDPLAAGVPHHRDVRRRHYGYGTKVVGNLTEMMFTLFPLVCILD